MSYPNTIADYVLDEIPVLTPEDLLDLKRISWKRRALIREEPLKGAEARLLVIPRRKSIITLSSLITSPQRKRFAIAHELGHLEMHKKDLNLTICSKSDIDDSCKGNKVDLEQEANQFAASFLMPARFVGKLYSTYEPSFDVIRNVQNQFDVSLTAAALRFLDFSPEPMAVVYSKNGVIRWFRSTSEFKEMEVFVDVRGTVGKNTNAGRMFANLPVKDEWRDVRASDWLREGSYRRAASIKEWSFHMPNYKAVLTLLWIDDDIFPEDVFWS